MISVVLRAKNEAHWLGRCLTALTRQSVPDLDVILVDNDSTDNGVAIAERFGCQIRHIDRHEFS